MNIKRRWIGDRAFYKRISMIAVPIMIQYGITNFVGMLDNMMVGKLGTEPMSGVAIVNQLMFIFNLCIFGGLSGIGIFTAQYYGKGDEDGIRYTVRQQILLAAFLFLGSMAIFLTMGDSLISLYLQGDGGTAGSVENTFLFARSYLTVMYLGLLPFALSQVYSNTLRSTGETMIPMIAGITAVFVNLGGNYILIYGKCGLPAMGVNGAAYATVISRFVELVIVAVWAHAHTDRYPFMKGVYAHLFRIPAALNRNVAVKGLPLMLNEALWSAGMAALVQNYSIRGLSAMAAVNISQTITNVFNVSFAALGSAIAIMLGQTLGAGEIEQSREDASKMIFFSVAVCVAVGLIEFLAAGAFPRVYNTTDEIRDLAAGLIRISAAYMPFNAFMNAAYFIIRSGGKTWITFVFDCGFCWVVTLPVVYVLAHYTQMPLLPMYIVVQGTELLKCVFGWYLVRKGTWAQNIVQEDL